MNDFEKRLKVDEKVKQAIKAVEEAYAKQNRVLSEEDKEKTSNMLRKFFEKGEK